MSETTTPTRAETNRRIRKFAVTMFVAFGIIGGLLWWWDRPNGAHGFWIAAGAMLVLGLPVPILLWPVERAWYWFAFGLGWLNMRILLSVVFYVMFVPVGLFMKLIGRDVLHRTLDRSADTYWQTRERQDPDPESYERQY